MSEQTNNGQRNGHSDKTDVLKQLEDQLENQGELAKNKEVWRPESRGEQIVGVILDVSWAESDYNDEIPVLEVATFPDKDKKLIFLSRKVLRQSWEETGEPGEDSAIAVKYLGKKQSSDNGSREYYDYLFLTEEDLSEGEADELEQQPEEMPF
jgi:hypothetical protein